MKTLEMITNICNDFTERKLDVEEFQSRLQTLMIEDELKRHLKNVLRDADNRLEEIRFCSLESHFYQYGVEVANSLLEKIKGVV